LQNYQVSPIFLPVPSSSCPLHISDPLLPAFSGTISDDG
jgi:hypothetical protein